jgi:hypothetical protein
MTRGKFSVIFDWVCLFVQVHFLPTTIKDEVPAKILAKEERKKNMKKDVVKKEDEN